VEKTNTKREKINEGNISQITPPGDWLVESFTKITLGIKSIKRPRKPTSIKSGTKSINVAMKSMMVIAELASFVLSTILEMNTPTPAKPRAMKKSNKAINGRL